MGKEIPVLFRQLRESVYPGHRGGNGFVENLSSYRERVRMRDGGIVDEWLAFDVERHVSWDGDYKLQPFAYSMMVDGFYPVARLPLLFGQNRPTIEDFSFAASRLPGFVLDEEITLARNGLQTYRNPGRNLFINWSKTNRICVGVIQQSPVPQLEVVAEEVVPYAVEVFNHLSPTKKIAQEIVERVVGAAVESNNISPRRR